MVIYKAALLSCAISKLVSFNGWVYYVLVYTCDICNIWESKHFKWLLFCKCIIHPSRKRRTNLQSWLSSTGKSPRSFITTFPVTFVSKHIPSFPPPYEMRILHYSTNSNNCIYMSNLSFFFLNYANSSKYTVMTFYSG